jgi:hypothetical protein
MVDKAKSTIDAQGWTASPDGRGTFDILWSCSSTIFLCTWSVLCINIGAPETGFFRGTFMRKLFLASACVMVPDFIQYNSLGQWESARRSVKDFSKKYPQWSMKHAFFADMGGFVLKTRDGLSWPLDARELWYLIEENWIKEPMISNQILLERKFINDKDKASRFVRIIAFSQALWFVISCIGRVCQNLTITTLELTTLSVITTAIFVQFFWAHKPADVEVPFILKVDATAQEIRGRAGYTTPNQWYDTPLDFIHPEKSYALVSWDYMLNILRFLRLLPARKIGLIGMRRDDNFPLVSFQGNILSAIVGVISFGMNFIAWNFWFPSTIERELWRASAIVLLGWGTFAWTYHMVLINIFPDFKKRSCRQFALTELNLKACNQKKTSIKANIMARRELWMHKMRNISPNKDPAMTIPLRFLLLALSLSSIYVVARCYVIIEDLIAFRAQPPHVYMTVNWSKYIPHIG